MGRSAGAWLAVSAFALTACTDFILLIGKSDQEIAAILGEDAPNVVVREVPVGAEADRPLFIKGATIIAMNGTAPDVGSVLIKNDMIEAIGPDLVAPEDAEVVEAEGLTLLPGLADMHVHHFSKAEGPLYIANGITTVRSFRSTTPTAGFDEPAKNQVPASPRVYTPGPIMDGPEPIWGAGSVVIENAEEAIGAVRAQKAAGFTAIKIYEKLSEEAFTAAVQEAKAQDMQVYAHTPLSMTVDQVISLEIDSLEHLNNAQDYLVPDDYPWPEDYNSLRTWAAADDDKMDALAQMIAEADVWNAATLEVTIGRYASALEADDFFASEIGSYVGPGLKGWWSESARRIQTWATPELIDDARAKQLAFLKALYDANAPLLIGTDTPNPFVVPGFSLHGEIASFSEAGIPNQAILRIATADAAAFLGEGNNFGKVEEAMRADLILVDGDPLTDLSVLRNPTAVIAGGEHYDRDELDAMLAEARDHESGSEE
ncbi:MAG: amidohydrolase family protein [Pseudomonadota bacterium]